MGHITVQPRVRNLALAATGAGALTTLALTTVSGLRITYSSSELRASVETAQALIAFLVTNLLYLRFRRTRLLPDLLLVYGIGLFGMANVFFVVALATGRQPGTTVFQTWAPLLLRIAAGVAVVGAAWAAPRRIPIRGVIGQVLGAQMLTIVLIAGAVIGLQHRLPVGIRLTDPIVTAGRPELVGHPVLLAAQLVLMMLFWLAAGGFVSRSFHDSGPLTAALVVGLILAGFSRLSFSLYPSLYTDIVHTGDFLRLASYMVFLVGAEREIHSYWQGRANLAVVEERERTARELHDGLVQELSFIRSQAAGFTSGRANPAVLVQVSLAADRALEESRRAVRALSGETVEEPLAVLRMAAEEIAIRAGASVHLQENGSVRVPPAAVVPLSRIVREASSNAVRHGQAKLITICVEPWAKRFVRVTVSDDGTGFDPDAVTDHGGFGLRSMRERAEALGGEFVLSSSDGQGTVIEVVLPRA